MSSMGNGQQPPDDPAAHVPRHGWGGEYDADATASFEFPTEGHPGAAGDEHDPLAAPGHGYQPPALGQAPPPPATAEATTDPGATGQWTMPFAYGGAEAEAPPAGYAGQPDHADHAAFFAAGAEGATVVDGAASAPPGSPGSPPAAPAGHPEHAPAGETLGVGDARSAAPAADWAVAARPAPRDGGRGPWPPDPAAGPAAAEPAAEPAASHDQDGPGPDRPERDAPGAAAGGDGLRAAEPRATAAPGSDHPALSYVLRVNGAEREVTGAWIGESLLYVLRERLGLAGAKDGCAQGECGACSVQVDGRLVAACLVPAATAVGSEIRTVEGLGDRDMPSDVQRALAAIPVQCGFCLPGMAMTVHDLLEGNHSPTELETRQALSGNLCRCTGYQGVLSAVRAVVEERARAGRAAEEAAASEPPPVGEGAAGEGAAHIPHQAGPPASGAGGM